jgi:hypothetical protein
MLFCLFRYRKGFVDIHGLKEHLTVFALGWLTVAPFVCFQSMLCARDENQIVRDDGGNNNYPSASSIMSPILVVLGLITILVCIISWFYRSPYQVSYCSRYCDMLLAFVYFTMFLGVLLIRRIHFVHSGICL